MSPGDGGLWDQDSRFDMFEYFRCGDMRNISVEDPQGIITDDTSLNQIILYCCDLPHQGKTNINK